ncbi:MAG: hypothetical protein KAQ99_08730 [Candidatus Aureabacteria bacterium]|nr:hypothetical protein [Candidatus Auribacterota bacterium]
MPSNKQLQIIMKMRDEASKKLKGLRANLRRFSASMQKMGQSFAKIGLVLTAAAAAAAFAMKQIINTGITYGLQLDKMAKQTSMTTEEFAKLGFAADQEHTSMEALTKVVPILAKYMEYSRQGMETYSREFNKMGITVTDTEGKLRSTYDVLLDMAEFYKTAENKTQALAIATTLLGRRGAELIPLLKLGKDGIKALGDSAEELGIVLNSQAAAAMKEFDDEVTTAKTGLKGISSQITIFLLPALKEITQIIIKDIKAFVSWTEKLKDNEKALIAIKTAFVEGHKEAVNFITTLIVGAGQVVDSWNEVRVIMDMVRIGWAKFSKVVPGVFSKKIRAELSGYIKAWQKSLDDAVKASETDFSERMVTSINKFKTALGLAKEKVDEVKKALSGKIRDPFQMPEELTKTPMIENIKKKWTDLGVGIRSGLETSKEAFKSFKDNVSKGTVTMVNNMKTMWSDFIYNAFIGELTDAREAFAEFGRGVLRIIANIITEWATMQVITGLLTLAGAGSGTTGATSVGTGGATGGAGTGGAAVAFAHTGRYLSADLGRTNYGMNLKPDEVPIIAQTRERVLNREDTVNLDNLIKNSKQASSGGNSYTFHMTIVATDERSFREKLAQNKDIYVGAAQDSIERNGLLGATINKYARK